MRSRRQVIDHLQKLARGEQRYDLETQMTAKATTIGPGNAKYDADTARLIASLRKEPRKPARRSPRTAPKPAGKRTKPS